MKQTSLFEQANDAPLAEKLRPQSLDEFIHEGIDPALYARLTNPRTKLPSLILWGSPGTGKTTFAKLLGKIHKKRFVELSAVLSGVKDIREVVESAHLEGSCILFIDEIHRYNKAQQDALLPHVEKGTITLIGATTENPSFYLNQALLSRSEVVLLQPIAVAHLEKLAQRAATKTGVKLTDEVSHLFAQEAQGDARRLLNMIEQVAQWWGQKAGAINKEDATSFLSQHGVPFYDRSGDEHYGIISAFIKSLRGSDPDAALYWGFRMIEAGEDPRFVIRRMIIFASEDVGNADPRGLQIAIATADAFERVGLPEGKIPIAHCITYLASAPKSNRSYMAMHGALEAVKKYPRAPVPKHLRNAPTKMMKSFGYGAAYLYPHDFDDAMTEQRYLPDEIQEHTFYQPSQYGYEKSIGERLALIREKRKVESK